MITFKASLRLSGSTCVAFVGAGGKTTAMFSLAYQLDPPVFITTTTHLGVWEANLADRIVLTDSDNPLDMADEFGINDEVLLFIGPVSKDDRYKGISRQEMEKLREYAKKMQIPLLIEADGSRKRPLKAPADHEPAIPGFVDHVVVVAGLSALGKPLTDKSVHRRERFSSLSGIQEGDKITPDGIRKVLCHQSGGLKNIPARARKTLLLNQADTETLQHTAMEIVQEALLHYDNVVIASLVPQYRDLEHPGSFTKAGSLRKNQIISVHEHIAGIILAAGGSRRFGEPKQLLDWSGEPLVRRITRTALASGLSEVVIVTGANSDEVSQSIEDLPVIHVHNPGWQEGQSTSIRLGVEATEDNISAAIFFLVDQPFISVDLVQKLVTEHSISMAPVIAPSVNNQRGNPVLFDRITFRELLKLKGNEGGRTIFDRFPPRYVKWDDPRILLDIDTPEDFQRIKESTFDLN